MGVDYYSCEKCGETFPDCGEYISCECGRCWCDNECAKEDGCIQDKCKLGYEVIEGYEQNEECEKEECENCENFIKGGCNYCRGEDFDDYILLEFALSKLCLSREQLIEQYKLSV